MKNTFFILFSLVFAACSSDRILTESVKGPYSEFEIKAIENSGSSEVILLVNDDDSVGTDEQLLAMSAVFNEKVSIYALQKMDQDNLLRKNSTDAPKIRLENLISSYRHLLNQQKIDSTKQITVLGIGEGTLIAPQFAVNIHSDRLLLINPYYSSMGNNIVLSMQEQTENTSKLAAYFMFEYDQEWIEFIEKAGNGLKPDEHAGPRSLKYYSGYWNLEPSEILNQYQNPVRIVVFDDYFFTSNYDKKALMNLSKKPNVESIRLAGDMFTKFSVQYLKDAAFLSN